MKAKDIFKVGNLGIGYVGNGFQERFGDDEVEESSRTLHFDTLKRTMSDEQITKEFNVQDCTLGDVVAFLKNPPEGTKDGNWNLFYIGQRVVNVHWGSDIAQWRVRDWDRNSEWSEGDRVFSPSTDKPSVVESSEVLTLESLNARLLKIEAFINPDLLK